MLKFLGRGHRKKCPKGRSWEFHFWRKTRKMVSLHNAVNWKNGEIGWLQQEKYYLRTDIFRMIMKSSNDNETFTGYNYNINIIW
jgi:hypothetical protein